MDKKTLLAIVLSFLILIIWQKFLVKPPEKPAPGEESTTEEITKEESTKTDEPDAEKTPVETAKPEPKGKKSPTPVEEAGREIEITTPKYNAVLTTEGGRISSFRLNDYSEAIEENSPPVDIILEEVKDLSPKIAFDTNLEEFSEDIVYATEATDKIELNEGDEPKSVVLVWEGENFRVEKSYTFNPDTYGIDFDFKIYNLTDKKVKGDLDVSLFEYVKKEEKKSFSLFSGYQFPASFLVFINGKVEREVAAKVKEGEDKVIKGDISWIGFDSKYFMLALLIKEVPGETTEAIRLETELIEGVYRVGDFSLSAGESFEGDMGLYLGPKDPKAMDEVGHSLSEAIDYGFFAFLSIPLVKLLKFFFIIFKNYGVAIILLTVVVRLLLYPITHKSMKSMKDMQKIQPLMKEIREKYKNDKEKMNQEVMRLYQTHKINPLGGCLPLFLQLPIFIALYKALYVAIDLRHAPFWLWIQDLSEKDPYYVTPIVMGLSYFLQQKLTPTGADPTQQKIMLMMPIVFTVIFLNLPSGLVLYFLVSNILSIAQQLVTNKIVKD
ncbi:MAG: membrane protein insertase YidC [Deltaproteobacteria bacterium]|uniref:Membrane protein insertase YidC n=1 Tax=Candidatus Zymogenus saltonus TaxID=2844893 RepID=A0A9D8KG33_9DELT|nr:membrane protein insertase YidC [Candidatus Zymogenus saltonus]